MGLAVLPLTSPAVRSSGPTGPSGLVCIRGMAAVAADVVSNGAIGLLGALRPRANTRPAPELAQDC